MRIYPKTNRFEINEYWQKMIKVLADCSESFRLWLHKRNETVFRYGLLSKAAKEVDSKFITLTWGAEKAALIIDENEEIPREWVVKFPKDALPSEEEDDTPCDAEVFNYEMAQSYGVEEFLAECWRSAVTIDDEEIPFYVMRRAEVNEDEVMELSGDGEFYTGEEDSVWNAFFSEGREEVNNFYGFCVDYKINDLHDHNVGFLNGNLICIDYSGYGN